MTLAVPKNDTSAIAGKANIPAMTTANKTTNPFLMIPSPRNSKILLSPFIP
jgi:hypothetical protein